MYFPFLCGRRSIRRRSAPRTSHSRFKSWRLLQAREELHLGGNRDRETLKNTAPHFLTISGGRRKCQARKPEWLRSRATAFHITFVPLHSYVAYPIRARGARREATSRDRSRRGTDNESQRDSSATALGERPQPAAMHKPSSAHSSPEHRSSSPGDGLSRDSYIGGKPFTSRSARRFKEGTNVECYRLLSGAAHVNL